MPHHFYTTDPSGELAPGDGYIAEGITGYVYAFDHPGTHEIHRFFNPTTLDHFYTHDPNGEGLLDQGYHKEPNHGFWMYLKDLGDGSVVALYRWWHPTVHDHFYTTDPSGERAPGDGYQFQEIAGYLFPEGKQNKNSVALNRWVINQ